MPQGLQVFDASGNIMIDTNTFILKTGAINVGNITAAGSVNISAYTAAGAEVVPVLLNNDGMKSLPVLTKTSTTLSWASSGGSGFNASLKVMLV